MTTKRNNTTHNEVVVERVLTSDAFLTREIKKAPMKTTGDSLIADLTHLPNDLKITIQGAREHNLKNVDLEFPRNRMVVFTGLSGSGKSSLAFDTLFADGPAQVCRIAVGVRAPVLGADGQAGRRLHRRG